MSITGRMEGKLLVIFACVAFVKSGPVNTGKNEVTHPNGCATRCTENSKFHYQPGVTYEFQYTVDSKTSVQGASEGHSSLKIQATAEVEVHSKCDMVLKLSDVTIMEEETQIQNKMKDVDGNREFKKMLEKYSLQFAFQDGSVEHICPQDDESRWALNVKRGILSAFQNTMTDFERDQLVKETDVIGRCHADYKIVQKGWTSTTFRKTKNLMKCFNREGYRSTLQSTLYRLPYKIHSLPLMKSSHDCDQEISSDRILKNTKCHEVHVFRPFSKDSNGAATEISQSLQFVHQRHSLLKHEDFHGKRTSLVFDHDFEAQQNALQVEAGNKLDTLCHLTQTDIRPEVPRIFSELVFIMKSMEYQALNRLYEKVKGSMCPGNADRTRKFFLDAIPMLSTSASIRLMRIVISNKDISSVEKNMWLMSLSFIRKPSTAVLRESKLLLNDNLMDSTAVLSVTNLVHSYCETNVCKGSSEVNEITLTLKKSLGRNCKVTENNRKQILITLRGLGNIGYAEVAIPSINKCFENKDNPMEVRVAAIEAFRRMTCGADRNNLMEIFRDSEEDSELRIHAYLAVMSCSNEFILTQIKETLKSEEVNQVGSFVWTHLTNIMETSDPLKQSIKQILEDEQLTKEFNLDKRKFSRNYEGSFFSEKFDTGAIVESNIIFSSKSFLPRSAMLNLTVDVFGNSINLFEIGGRIEGLDYFFEQYFGPRGYFGDKTDIKEQTKHPHGIKTAKIDRMQQKLGLTMDELKGSMYMRVFGNELQYQDLKDFSLFDSFKNLKFSDLLKKLSKEYKETFSQSFIFVDSKVTLPTVAGLPLQLNVNGSATLDLAMSGKINLKDIIKRPRNLVIEGEINPSGAVEITGTMSMDAFVSRSGVKMQTTLHSSTGMKGKLMVEGGQVITAQFDMPRDKMEIISLKTSFFTLHKNVEVPQNMILENKMSKTLCSGSRVARITGLELCGEVHFPNASMKSNAPYFPLTGPVSLDVVLHKRDTHTKYFFEAKMIRNSLTDLLRIIFDTPGSKQSREVAVDFVHNKADKNVDIGIITPWKRINFIGSFENTEEKKGVSGTVRLDRNTYSVSTHVTINKDGQVEKYVPHLEVIIPNRKKITLMGKVERNAFKNFETDLVMTGVTDDPVTFSAAIVNTPKNKRISGRFSYQKNKNYLFDSSMKIDYSGKQRKIMRFQPKLVIKSPKKDIVDFSGLLDYREGKQVSIQVNLGKVFKKDASIKLLFNKIHAKKGIRTTYQMKGNIAVIAVTTKFDTRFEMRQNKKGDKIYLVKLRGDYVLPKIGGDGIVFSNKVTLIKKQALLICKTKGTLQLRKNPHLNFKLTGSVVKNKKGVNTDLAFIHGENPKDNNKKLTFSLDANQFNLQDDTLDKANFRYVLKTKYPYKDIDISASGKHHHTTKDLDSSLHIKYDEGKDIDIGVQLKDNRKKTDTTSGVVTLKYPGRDMRFDGEIKKQKPGIYTGTLEYHLEKGKKNVVTVTYKNPKAKPKLYTITSDMKINNIKPINLKGELNLETDDFRIMGDVDYGKSNYATTLEYKFKYGKFGRLFVDLKYPERHVIGELDAKAGYRSYSSKVDLQLDADGDKDKRLLVDGSVKYINYNNIDGSVNVIYPGHNYHAIVKHAKSRGYLTNVDIGWSKSKNITLNLDLDIGKNKNLVMLIKTPFENYKDIKMEGSHQCDTATMKSTALIKLNAQKEYSVTWLGKKPFSKKFFDGTLDVETPHKKYDKLKLKILHTYNSELKSSVRLDVGSEFASVVFSGLYSSRDKHIKGSANFTSSLKNYEELTVSTDLEKPINGMLDGKLMFSHNFKSHTGDINIKYDPDNFLGKNSGSIQFDGFEKQFKLSWSHAMIKRRELKSILSANWNHGSKTIYFKIYGTRDGFPRSEHLVLNAEIQTPFSILKQFEVNFDHELALRKLISTLSINKNRENVIKWNADFQLDDDNVDGGFNIKIAHTEEFSMRADAKYSKSPLTGNFVVTWLPGQSIRISKSINYDIKQGIPYFINSEFRITTPFKNFDNMFVQIEHRKAGNIWITNLNLEYPTRNTIELETKIGFETLKKFNVLLKTPYKQIRMFEYGFEFSGETIRDFSLKSHYDKTPGSKYTTETTLQLKNGEILGQFKLTTPVRGYEYVQLDLSHSGHKRNFKNFIEYTNNFKSIRVGTHFNIDEKIEMGAELKSPFEGHEEYGFHFSSDLKDSKIDISSEVIYSPVDKVRADVNVEWGKTISTIVSLKTPIRGYKYTRLTFTHTGEWYDFKSHLSYLNSMKTIEVDITHKHSKSENIYAFTLQTPFKDYERFNIELLRQHSLSGAYKVYAEIEYWMKRKLIVNYLKTRGNKGTDRSLTITAPFMKDTNLLVNHVGNKKVFTNTVSGYYGDEIKMNGLLKFRLNSLNTVTLNGNFTVLHHGKDKQTEGSFDIIGSSQNGNGKFSMVDGNDEYGAILNYDYDSKLDGSLKISAPNDLVIADTIVTIKHGGKLNDFQSYAEVTNPKIGQYDSTVTFVGDTIDKLSVVIELNTPYKNYRQNKLQYRHDLKTSEFDGFVGLAYGSLYNEITTKVSGKSSPELSASLDVTTPYEGYKSTSASGRFDQRFNKLDGEIKLSRGIGQDYSLSSTVSKTFNPMSLKSKLHTPHPTVKNLEIDIYHKGNLNDFTSTLNMKSPVTGNIDGKAIWHYQSPHDIHSLLSFNSDIKHFEEIKLEFKNEKDYNNLISSLEVAWEPSKTIKVENNLKYTKKLQSFVLNDKVTIVTPFDELETGSVTLDFTRLIDEVRAEITVENNAKEVFEANVHGQNGREKKLSLTIRKPLPMRYAVTGEWSEDTALGNLVLEWDSTKPESKCEIEAMINREQRFGEFLRDLTLKVKYSKEVIIVKSNIFTSDVRFSHQGQLIWDEYKDKKIIYQVQWNDRSSASMAAYDGELTFSTPIRALQLNGNYENSKRKKTTEMTLYWDANKDKSKNIGLEIALEPAVRRTKSSAVIKLPAIKKEYRLFSEWSINDGDTIYDTKTEFDFTGDWRKNVILSSKLKDLSQDSNVRNYSLEVEVSQAFSDVSIQTKSTLGFSKRRCTFNTDLSYLTAEKEKKTLALRTEINKLRKQVFIEINSPLKTIDLSGKIMNDPYRIQLKNAIDGLSPVRAELIYDDDNHNIEFVTHYDKRNAGKNFHMKAQFINESALHGEIFHGETGVDRITDTLMNINLNTSQILHTRIKWRPEMINEFQESALSTYNNYKSDVVSVLDKMRSNFGDELAEKYDRLMTTVVSETEPVMKFFYDESKDLNNDIKILFKALNRMLNEDLSDEVKMALIELKKALQDLHGILNHNIEASYRNVELGLAKVQNYPVRLRFAELIASVKKNINLMEKNVLRFSNEVMYRADIYLKEATAQLRILYMKLNSHIEEAKQAMKKSSIGKALKLNFDGVSSKIPSVEIAEYFNNIHQLTKKKFASMKLPDKFNSIMYEARDQMNGLMNIQELQHMRNIGNEIYQQAIWAYNYWELEETLQQFVDLSFEYVKDEIKTHITKHGLGFLQMDKSRIIVFDPENGEIQFEIHLPFPMESLQTPPEISLSKYVKRVEKLWRKYIPASNYSVWDTYYKYKSELDIDNWIPPFDSYASLHGNQHFTTFDGKNYEFVGRCSYILTRDFVNNNFTVILNYEHDKDPEIKSVTVMSAGHIIEVFRDNRVKIDNRNAEFPIIKGSLKVMRSGNMVMVRDGNNFFVEINLVQNLYLVGINGWYHGKVAGLLGTFDNEQSNDFMKPDTTIVDEVEAFAQSWEVSKKCRSHDNYAAKFHDPKDVKGFAECAALFEDMKSPLRPCFGQVHPSDFMHACLTNMLKSDQGHCTTSAVYTQHCKMAGVPLQVPSQCVHCSETKENTANNDVEQKSADFVFVIEENKCNKDAAKVMSNLVTEMEEKAMKRGFVNNRYAVIGFSDQAYTHTLNGELFNDAIHFAKGLENMKYSVETVDNDLRGAIEMASTYPYRPDVSRSVVLLDCASCGSANIDYLRAVQLLSSNDIAFHVLTPHTFNSSMGKQKEAIYGIDKDAAYTEKDRNDKKLEGDKMRLKDISIPYGVCFSAALNTRGSVFDIQHITTGREVSRKTFQHVLADRLLLTAEPSSCQKCKCIVDTNGLSRSVCTACSYNSWLNALYQVNGYSIRTLILSLESIKTSPTVMGPSRNAGSYCFRTWVREEYSKNSMKLT